MGSGGIMDDKAVFESSYVDPQLTIVRKGDTRYMVLSHEEHDLSKEIYHVFESVTRNGVIKYIEVYTLTVDLMEDEPYDAVDVVNKYLSM